MENKLNTEISKQEKLNEIFDIIKKHNVSNYEISKNTGVSEAGLGSITNGNVKNPRLTTVEAIHSYLVRKYTSKVKLLSPKNEVIALPEEDYMMVEYVDLETAAGVLGGGFSESYETETRLVPREYGKGNYLVVRVSGNSMDDGTKKCLSNGDEILIRQWLEQIEYLPIKQKLFVVNTYEGSVVKQITHINLKEQYITLHSFNPDYEDYDVTFDEIIQIFTVEKIVNSKIYF